MGGWDSCGHSQHLISELPAARCAQACATETIGFRSEGCKEERWEILPLGEPLSRFVLGLLKPFLSSLSQAFKISFGVAFFFLFQSKVLWEMDISNKNFLNLKKRRETERKKPINPYSTNLEITTLNSWYFLYQSFFVYYTYVYIYIYMYKNSIYYKHLSTSRDTFLLHNF